jgi:hypothetical protein
LGGRKHTACPELNGLTSRNARILSDSKSLKEGISPVVTMIFISPSFNLNLVQSNWAIGTRGEGKYL